MKYRLKIKKPEFEKLDNYNHILFDDYMMDLNKNMLEVPREYC